MFGKQSYSISKHRGQIIRFREKKQIIFVVSDTHVSRIHPLTSASVSCHWIVPTNLFPHDDEQVKFFLIHLGTIRLSNSGNIVEAILDSQFHHHQ